MKPRILVRGLLGTLGIHLRKRGTSGTNSARYCYSVFLRHLTLMNKDSKIFIPKTVAEIGPGDSLGIGLTALLCGADEYYAFDIIDHASTDKNLLIFEELLELFRKREAIPGPGEFPRVKPEIENYDFPSELLTETHLNKMLDEARIANIREALKKGKSGNIIIKYIVPWDQQLVLENSIDLIYSQAVMEHLLEIEPAYSTMHKWLRIGGMISHEIDYAAHETHSQWNGHWYYSDLMWKIIMSGRKYAINRLPHSVQRKIISNLFTITTEIKDFDKTGMTRKIEGKNFEEEDYITRSALIQAYK